MLFATRAAASWRLSHRLVPLTFIAVGLRAEGRSLRLSTSVLAREWVEHGVFLFLPASSHPRLI